MKANCIICSDFFDEINPISAAKCGHVYHSSCLTLWVDQSKSCPHCRQHITRNDVHKLYFNFPPNYERNTSELENEVLNLKTELSAKNAEILAHKKNKEDLMVFVREAENRASNLQQEAYKYESELSELRLRIKSLIKLETKVLKLEKMNVSLSNDLEHLNNVKTIVNGTQKDVEDILKEYSDQSEAAKQLATYCTCLKRELQKLIESKNKLVELNSRLKKENCTYAAKVKCYEDAMAVSRKNINRPENNTPAKKLSLFNKSENSSFVANTSISSDSNNSSQIDVSPLVVSFNKSKFNLCIKSSTGEVYKPDSNNQNSTKDISVASVLHRKQDGDSSIKTGYNGLGGHSNFIVTSGIKKNKTLKRKL